MRRDVLYGRKWRAARRVFLSLHPYCAYCREEGRIRPAVDVDHIKPHKGDPILFWDESNWQGLCKHHHQSTKAREERGKKRPGCDINGTPYSRTGDSL